MCMCVIGKLTLLCTELDWKAQGLRSLMCAHRALGGWMDTLSIGWVDGHIEHWVSGWTHRALGGWMGTSSIG